MIVKVQRSQFPRGKVLIYNKTRSVMWEGVVDARTDKAIRAEKSYWHAHLNKKHEVVLDREAPWQEW